MYCTISPIHKVPAASGAAPHQKIPSVLETCGLEGEGDWGEVKERMGNIRV
jgi:hypothetical protein